VQDVSPDAGHFQRALAGPWEIANALEFLATGLKELQLMARIIADLALLLNGH
jgi:hypothetical protein